MSDRSGGGRRAAKRTGAAVQDKPKNGEVAISEDDPGNPFAAFGGSRSRHFNNAVMRATLEAVWAWPDDKEDTDRRRSAAAAALLAFRPKDEVEAMLAAQAVAMHLGAMECFRRTMIPEQGSETASRLRKDGANLSRAMVEMLDALDRKRGRAPQVVRVERVVVQNGGQAIVGNVAGAAGPSAKGGGE